MIWFAELEIIDKKLKRYNFKLKYLSEPKLLSCHCIHLRKSRTKDFRTFTNIGYLKSICL